MEDCFDLGPFSPDFHRAAELIGRRWSGAVLYALFHGERRFTDIAAAVPGLSARMLSERLRELESEGLIDRRAVPDAPARLEYHLTEKGRDLGDVFRHLADWAARWTEAPRDAERA